MSGKATLIRKGYLERNVEGLRDIVTGSVVKVYRANPDGTKGELVKIEEDTPSPFNFTGSRYGSKR